MRGRPRACVRALVMAHQIDLFCTPQLADARRLEADRNGGSASAVADYSGVAYCSASSVGLAAGAQRVRRWVRVRPRRKLPDGDDDLAFSVPLAEIAQRLGHLTERKAAVDDGSDLSRLAELNEGV
jgi:hypothetical protein